MLDHTTLSRRAENLEVVRPRPDSGPVHLLVDSTGRGVVSFAPVVGRGSLLRMTAPNPFRGFRYPAEVIRHALWLYHLLSPYISLRDVELILAARGIVVSYENIRDRGLRCGRLFANELKRRRPRPGDEWFG